MVTVEITSHLYRFFPDLRNRTISVPPGSVAEVLASMDKITPGFSDYIVDEHGALRKHVKLSINDTIVIDKKTLSDRVPQGATVFIFQALSGG